MLLNSETVGQSFTQSSIHQVQNPVFPQSKNSSIQFTPQRKATQSSELYRCRSPQNKPNHEIKTEIAASVFTVQIQRLFTIYTVYTHRVLAVPCSQWSVGFAASTLATPGETRTGDSSSWHGLQRHLRNNNADFSAPSDAEVTLHWPKITGSSETP